MRKMKKKFRISILSIWSVYTLSFMRSMSITFLKSSITDHLFERYWSFSNTLSSFDEKKAGVT